MDKKIVFYVTGRLMMVLGAIMLIPLAIAVAYDLPDTFADILEKPETLGFILAVLVSVLLGYLLTRLFRSKPQLEGIKEGFAIVSMGWVSLGFLGSIPLFVFFVLSGGDHSLIGILKSFTDAYFEICSGFTTTGATIFNDVEILPHGILFWRSLTHWLGGMGIITLAIAIFPAMGVSGYHMFRGEVPGPSPERIQPRLAQTAAILWGVYALLSGIETTLLMTGGMNWFDSLCHTFGTMATGGFSTKNLSVGFYDNQFIDWVITIFMLLAGVNFMVHYRLLRNNFIDIKNNSELHFYVGTILLTVVISTGILYMAGTKPTHQAVEHFHYSPVSYQELDQHVQEENAKISTLYGSFRRSAFQVVSIVTTTGFGTADFDIWPDLLRFALLLLMFWGGCAGSTGGGMKMVRIMVILKTGWRELKTIISPHAIVPVKVGGMSMEEKQVISIGAFFMLFMVTFVVGTALMTLFIPDLITAASSAAATLGNIGPGLGGVGSTQTYAWIPIPGKWVLIVLMLLGRLELFTMLLALRPSFWKR